MSAIKSIALGNWKNATKNGTEAVQFSHYAAARVIQSGVVETLWYAGEQPDAILGLLPLYAVQYLEVGRSQDILQYRAVGAEFLAQQQGGNLGMRIDIMLVGSWQNTILNILTQMALMGREDTVHDNKSDQQNLPTSDITSTIGGDWTSSSTNVVSMFSRLLKRGYMRSTGVGPNVSLNSAGNITVPEDYVIDSKVELKDIDDARLDQAQNKNKHITTPDDLTWAESVWHKTFPVITRDELLFDMYIETLVFRRTVSKGSKVIYCTILLRQFIPPDLVVSADLAAYKTGKSQGKPDTTLEAKDFRNITLARNVVTTPAVGKSNRKIGKLELTPTWLEFILNAMHRVGASTYAYSNKYTDAKRRTSMTLPYLYKQVLGSCGSAFKPIKTAKVIGF